MSMRYKVEENFNGNYLVIEYTENFERLIGQFYVVNGPKGHAIPEAEAKANAQRFAASARLLSACKSALAATEHENAIPDEIDMRLRDAIASAEVFA